MSRKPNYTPREAIKEENIVKIALWNGKVFHAGIVDVFDNGEKLHIVRLNKGRIVRREVLKIDYGPGNIRIISRPNCDISRGIGSENILPISTRKYSQNIKNVQGIIRKESMSKEFSRFLEDQRRFFAQREKDIKNLTYKIKCVEMMSRFRSDSNERL